MEFLFLSSFAVVLVKSVKIAGILQVFSFLVIPALIGRLFFRKQSSILLIGWLVGVTVSICGIWLSFRLDLPTAPLIVTGLASAFFLLLVLRIARGKAHAKSPAFEESLCSDFHKDRIRRSSPEAQNAACGFEENVQCD